jgi:hypothetical protein
MATVAPDDDTRERFIVLHYAYDPSRRQRRYRVAAAFDNAEEFEAYIEQAGAELERRQRDERVDAKESYSGVIKPPGYDAGVNAQRRFKRGAASATDIALLGSAFSHFDRHPDD